MPTSLGRPLLPDHPPLLHRDKYGEHTVWVSPDCPKAMERRSGHWCLADFTLNKQLYKGKASTLYQATDKASGAVVALKSYSKRRLSDLNWYQVEREIRLHAQLRHPHIIQLYAAFEDDNYVFMVTEFAAGGDLYEDLKRAGGQHRERTVAGELLPPFMAALAHMHALSVVHRDIKPENILLTADRTVKVADFGLSINWGEERPVTRAGTLDYMSPEVLLCPEKSRPEENKEKVELGYSDAVDVWAAGILAYELLVGRPPFERETREETYAWIAKHEPALPSWMSEGACDFITTALAKSARKRPSMAELLRHPWILQHSRRPSVPPASPAAPGLHLPLHELAGEAGAPFGELHRASLHGAKSCRDFGALLHAPSAGPAGIVGMLPSAPSATAASLAAAAVDATAPAAARPTTSSSRLGLGGSPGSQPRTPAAALLSAGAAASPAGPAVSLPASPMTTVGRQPSPAVGLHGSPASGSSLPPPSGMGVAPPARATSGAGLTAPTATADGSFFSAASFLTTSSTSASIEPISTSGHSFTHSAAAIKALSSSTSLAQTAAAPAAGDQQSAFLELYKSLAPPPAPVERPSHHSPRGGPLRRVGSGSRPGGSPGNSAGSSSKSLDAALLPPLAGGTQQQHAQEASLAAPATTLARLPSLRKAISSPLLLDLEGPSPAAAAAAAAPAAGEPAAAALAPIPEQRSSESEPAPQPDSGHMLGAAAARKQQAAEEADDEVPQAGGAFIPAVRARAAAPVRQPAAAGQQGEAEKAQQAAEAAAQDRMHEVEQPHDEKRSAMAAAGPPAGKAGSAAAGKSKARQPAGGSSYGSGIAKSASSLLNKLLGRKPPAAGPAAAAAGSASMAPPMPGAAFGAAAPAGAPERAKHKHKLSPPPVQVHAYAGRSSKDYSSVPSSGYGQPASPNHSESSPASGSPSGAGLVRRVPSSKQASGGSSPSASAAARPPASVLLRSPSLARSMSGRQAPCPPGAAMPDPAPASAGRPAAGAAEGGDEAAAGLLQRAHSTKGVRFAGLEPAGPSRNVEDLIPAVHGPGATESLSFTSAFSSLPTSSLPSLTAGSGAASPPGFASRKGSMSPSLSRKGSLAAGVAGSRGSVGRAPGVATAKPRSSKMASMPGDGGGKAGAATGSGGRADATDDAVQQSAASWSHPAAATSAGRAAAGQRKSSASAARLSMYRQLVSGPPGSGAKHGSLPKPTAAGKARR